MDEINKDINIKVKMDEALGSLKKLEQSYNDIEDKLSSVSEEQVKMTKSVEDVGKKSTGAVKGIDNIKKAFTGVGLAIKAIGIGLLLDALGLLKEVFMSNQGVVDAFSTSMNFLKIVFNDLFKFISGSIEPIKKFFNELLTNPKQKLVEFGDLIKANLIERFQSFLDTLGYVSSAIAKVFKGDFSGAMADAKKAGKEFVDVYTGVNNTVDRATKAIGDYVSETAKAAKAQTDLTNAAKLAAAQAEIDNKKLLRDAEKLRQVRDDESKSIADRIKANEKLGKKLNELEKQLLKSAGLDIAKAKRDLELNNNIENRIALMNAEAKVADVREQIEGFRSEQLANENALRKENNELNNISIDGIRNRTKAEKEFLAGLAQTTLGRLALQKEALKSEILSNEENIIRQRELYKEGTLARAQAEEEYLNVKQQLGFRDLEIDKQINDERIRINSELFAKNKEDRDRDLEARRAYYSAIESFATNSFGLLSSLDNDSKALAIASLAIEKGKAAADVVINAAKSIAVQSAASTAATQAQIAAMSAVTPFPASAALAAGITVKNAALLAKGIATTKLSAAASLASIAAATITSAKGIGGGGGSAGGSGGGGGSAGGAQPQFNIVGDAGTNQLQETIMAQQQRPIETYITTKAVYDGNQLYNNQVNNSKFY